MLDLYYKKTKKEIWVLDLFSGGGGVAKGLLDAGADLVIGIDNNNACKRYYESIGGKFILKDIFIVKKIGKEFNFKSNIKLSFFELFDLIWTSPVCTKYSAATNIRKRKDFDYDAIDFIEPTRKLLKQTGKPYIIENVIGAPIREDLNLCGLMFGLPLYRHRIFEIEGFKCEQPDHPKHDGQQKSSVYGNPRNKNDMKIWPDSMGLYHIPASSRQFAKAIPPVFAEYIFKQFVKSSKDYQIGNQEK